MPRIRSRSLIATALLVGLLAGGGVGIIVGATTVPQYKACVQANLLMRYSSNGICRSGERLVAWNVRGVAGPTGAQGPAGEQGPPGTGSGSAATPFWLASGAVGGGGTSTIVTLRLPAGTYRVDANVRLTNTQDSDTKFGRCEIPGVGSGSAAAGPFGGGSSFSSYVELGATTTISLACSLQTIYQAEAQIIATAAKLQPQAP